MLEIKELRRVTLTTISYVCSNQSEAYLKSETSKRLVGVKPVFSTVSIFIYINIYIYIYIYIYTNSREDELLDL